MSDVAAALNAGELHAALELQRSVVRAAHDLPSANLLLFELLTLAQKWREARSVLEGIVSSDARWPASRRAFHELWAAARRRQLGRRTRWAQPAPRHEKFRWRGYQDIRDGDGEAAWEALDEADEASPPIIGFVDGREFSDFRDMDDRFASVLEVLCRGRWIWVPLEQLRRVTLQPASGALDRVYRPAELVLSRGEVVLAHLPLVYPTSTQDEEYLLGLATDWLEYNGPCCGLGGRVWLIGEEECRAQDIRQLEFRPL